MITSYDELTGSGQQAVDMWLADEPRIAWADVPPDAADYLTSIHSAPGSIERCAICGMVANVDPSLHAERYGHTPEVWRDGQRLRFDWQTYTFRTVVS